MPAAITLLTDFGTSDYFVGAMKGVILALAPGAPVIDLTHEIPPHDVPAAAFTLLAATDPFPPGTVHLAVVDPGVGSERRGIAVAGRHLLVGPDNGIFSYLLERDPGARVFRIDPDRHLRPPASSTFHGRDLFAPVAAALANGLPPSEVGQPVGDPVRLPALAPERLPDGALRARILHVDRFGNCVTSLTRADLPGGALPDGARLRLAGGEIGSLRRYYAEADDREPFAIWGSAGFLEISLNRGSAATRLGARAGDELLLHR